MGRRFRVRCFTSELNKSFHDRTSLICGIRDGSGVPPPPPPPPIMFEALDRPQQTIYHWKGNLSESPIHFRYRQNILISRFYEQFLRNCRNLGHFRELEKISNSKNIHMLHIILKHVIWRLRIHNLFREIFKFRGFKKALMNFAKFIMAHIFATFKYFAKQTIYSDFPDHVLQNTIQHV